MLPLNLILLIDVTFSTPTPVYDSRYIGMQFGVQCRNESPLWLKLGRRLLGAVREELGSEGLGSNMAVGSDVRIWATTISTNAHNGSKIIFS